MSTSDHYRTLALERNATPDAIRKAYRALVLKWHPDRSPTDPDAPAIFAQIREAYEVLSHPQKRAAYDQLFYDRLTRLGSAARPTSHSPPTSSASSPASASSAPSSSPSPPPSASSRRTRPRRVMIRYADNTLEAVDASWGAALGILLIVFSAPPEVQRQVVNGWEPAFGILAGVVAFVAARVLDRTADLWGRLFENYVLDEELRWAFGMLSVVGIGTLVAVFGVHASYAYLIVTTAISAGLSATFGAAIGRAFVSSGASLRGQCFGMILGGTVALVVAGFLAASTALFSALPFSGFLFYETLGRSIGAASVAAGIVSAFASLREIEVIEY